MLAPIFIIYYIKIYSHFISFGEATNRIDELDISDELPPPDDELVLV